MSFWLTRVVPEKGPLNVCVCVCVSLFVCICVTVEVLRFMLYRDMPPSRHCVSNGGCLDDEREVWFE